MVLNPQEIAVLALLKLAAITGKESYREVADKTLSYFSGRMKSMALAVPYMVRAQTLLQESLTE